MCLNSNHFLSLFVHSFLLFSWIFVFITSGLSKCVYSSFLKMNLFIDLTSYNIIKKFFLHYWWTNSENVTNNLCQLIYLACQKKLYLFLT